MQKQSNHKFKTFIGKNCYGKNLNKKDYYSDT